MSPQYSPNQNDLNSNSQWHGSPPNVDKCATSPGFESWMLTAFALGELEPEQSQFVEQAMVADPSLRDELKRIQNSVRKVAEALQSDASSKADNIGLLSAKQREEIFASAVGSLPAHASSYSPPVRLTGKQPVLRRPYVIAALASAACVPLILFTSRSLLFQASDSLDRQPTLAHRVDLPQLSGEPLQTDAPQTDVPLADAAKVNLAESKEKSARGPTESVQQNSEGDDLASEAKNNASSAPPLTAPTTSGTTTSTPTNPSPTTSAPSAIPVTMGQASATSSVPISNLPTIQSEDPFARQFGSPPSLTLPSSESRKLGRESEHSTTQPYYLSDAQSYATSRSAQTLMHRSAGIASPQPTIPSEPYQTLGLPSELLPNLKSPPPGYSVPTPIGDRFDPIVENPFMDAEKEPITTFSADVDTASYSFVRQLLQQRGTLPSPEMVRIEELVNYFSYDYQAPTGDTPFSAKLDIAPCPWAKGHRLVRVGVQAKKVDVENRPRCNLVFLIDVSGSMADANKLPLVQRSLSMLVDRMEEGDRVAIVVYAGAAGMVLESTSGHNKEKIREAAFNLQAGGSTNGGEGIKLAYKIAKDNFISGGANRVILCTDGDFNVGLTNADSLIELVKEQAKSNVYLTCLGFGQGNYNDSLMERISKDGNGLYGMVDSDREAKKLMVDQVMGTLVTVAKDVKLQMDFNPNLVQSYRLIGYENRQLTNADFNNDLKDAGDIGAGHSVTALYEIIPTAQAGGTSTSEDTAPDQTVSKYAKKKAEAPKPTETETDPELFNEWLNLRIRYKLPEASESTKLEFALAKEDASNESSKASEADADFVWATSVAEFGLLLRQSKLAPNADWDRLISTASTASKSDEHRVECVELMRMAKRLSKPK